MKTSSTKRRGAAAEILYWTVTCSAAAAAGFSFVDALSFSYANALTVVASIFAAAFLCRRDIEIPLTGSKFLPKTVFAFWGIIWIGVSGGVILGTAAAAAGTAAGDRRNRFFQIASDAVSIFAAANIYYLVTEFSKIGQPFTGAAVAMGFASIAMTLTFYAAGAFINLLMNRTAAEGESSGTEASFRATFVGGAASLSTTIALYIAFNYFGIAFGLVLIPIALAGNLAYKVYLRRLEQKTREITEASRLHLATVEALATAIDARDQVGSGHVRRTQIYAVGLGKALGLASCEIDALQTGALLHDIGKLAVPDHILNKPGRLTRGEMEKAKIHSLVGSAILENIGFKNPVVPAVRYHHEFWDGSGYPENLSGNDIPLTARILTIADAFDTLRGARPYRAAIPRDEACSFLRARAGSQFDPHLVNVFLRNLRRFEQEIDLNGFSYDLESGLLESGSSAKEGQAAMNYVEQIQSANREVFTLYSLARDFSSALDIDETLSLFTTKIEEFVPFDTCVVYLMDSDGEDATAVCTVGIHAELLKNKHVAPGEGVTGYALRQRKAVSNVDPALDFGFAHKEIGHDYISMASLPLVAENRLVGAISLYSCSLPNYEEEHMRLIETVSRIAADAIEKSLQHAQAETYALTDPMTGLANARSLQIHFDKEVKRASRNGDAFQVLMLDLDGFKTVNDTFGHKIGDKMLQDVAAIIRAELRDYDFLARYAGDEFVAIVPNIDSHGMLELSRRIEAAVRGFELAVGEETARVGVSIGSACYPTHGENFDQVLVAADKAMYLTKAVHKQRSVLAKWADSPGAHRGEDTRRDSGSRRSAPQISDRHIQVLPAENSLIVEVDESHIVSSAVN